MIIDMLTEDRPERFSGTAESITEQLNNTAFSPMPDAKQYRERFAHYAKLMEGRSIRTDSADEFIEDIIREGLARRVD
jgi:hypothetical protein